MLMPTSQSPQPSRIARTPTFKVKQVVQVTQVCTPRPSHTRKAVWKMHKNIFERDAHNLRCHGTQHRVPGRDRNMTATSKYVRVQRILTLAENTCRALTATHRAGPCRSSGADRTQCHGPCKWLLMLGELRSTRHSPFLPPSSLHLRATGDRLPSDWPAPSACDDTVVRVAQSHRSSLPV